MLLRLFSDSALKAAASSEKVWVGIQKFLADHEDQQERS